jgi:hypothetical protein
MKAKIEFIQQYFKDQLLEGRFEPVEFESTYTIVSIEGYEFCIWNGEINPKYCKPWMSIGRTFMSLTEFTPEESEQLHGHISQLCQINKDRIRNEKIAKLEAELNKLKTI